jgi:hypothetical protein
VCWSWTKQRGRLERRTSGSAASWVKKKKKKKNPTFCVCCFHLFVAAVDHVRGILWLGQQTTPIAWATLLDPRKRPFNK